jgi:branched-chain amino acid transport system permease protein
MSAEQVVVIGVTAVLCLLLYAMFRYSKLGIAMQAASQNQLAAYYMGIPVKRLNGLVWGLAAAVAAIAGLLLAPITFVHANMGFIGLKAFPGRGGGRLRQPAGRHRRRPGDRRRRGLCRLLPARRLQGHRAYVVVLVMLMVKPNGLFGGSCARRSRGVHHAFHLQDRLRAGPGACSSTAASLLVRPAGAGLLAGALAGPEYWLAQLTFVLIYASPAWA